MDKKIFFYVLIRSWNSFEYFDRCIDSVLNQTYKNFKILFVDDASPYSKKQKTHIKESLKNHISVINKIRRYSLYNAYHMIRKYANNNDAIIFNLDGDDWLLNQNTFEVVASVYNKNPDCLLTWGECVLWDGVKISDKPSRFVLPNVNKSYNKKTIRENSYRLEPFYPLHPRTWKVWLFKKIKAADFKRPDGSWLQFAEDQAIYYPMLEMARGNSITINKPIYVHNFGHTDSDLNANLLGLVKDELIIRKKPKYVSLF